MSEADAFADQVAAIQELIRDGQIPLVSANRLSDMIGRYQVLAVKMQDVPVSA